MFHFPQGGQPRREGNLPHLDPMLPMVRREGEGGGGGARENM